MANQTERYTSKQLREDPDLRQKVLGRISGGAGKKPKPGAGPTGAGPAGVRPAGARPKWQPAPTHDCFLGIDPGVSTGIAIRDTRGTTPLSLLTLSFWKTVELIRSLHAQHGERLLVVIEDPNIHKSLYANKDGHTGEARTKIAQNVGANKREATLLLEFCRENSIGHETIAPLGKLDASQFKQITGIATGSQHARDAARLIFNR